MFERGWCRYCGESQSITGLGDIEAHDRRTRLCEGSGEPPAPDPVITFWRASSEFDSYIIVSRGQAHAEDLVGIDPDAIESRHLTLIQLEADEIATLVIDRIITGSITTTFPDGRVWSVGTLAVENRR